MTDRELLELAAKAAEIKHTGFAYHPIATASSTGLYVGDGVSQIWNPLTDDGDALRLAVRLNIIVHKGFAYSPTGRLFDCRELTTPIAATRRAIVHAAAEIGKELA